MKHIARFGMVLLAMVLAVSACSSTIDTTGTSGADGTSTPTSQAPDSSNDTSGATSTDLQAQAPSPEDTVLRVGVHDVADIPDFNPHTNISSIWVSRQLFSSLVKWEPGRDALGEPQPDLAQDWSISEDGLEYTFYLDESATWDQDYGQVTAHDVVFSYQRLAETSTYASEYSGVIRSVEAVDDTTVRFTLSEPNYFFFNLVSPVRLGFILPQAALEELGEDAYFEAPFGSGPYRIASFNPGSELVFEARANYFGTTPYFQRVEARFMPDDAAFDFALMNREVDIARGNIDQDWVTRMEDAGAIVDTADIGATMIIHMDTTEPPFDDVRVRRAIQMATDREGVLDGMGRGVFAAIDAPVPAPIDGSGEEVVEVPEYDPDEARALLAEAGYQDGFEVSIPASTRADHQRLWEILQAQWSEVGIDLQLELVDQSEYVSRVIDAGGFTLTLFPGVRPDAFSILSSFYACGSSVNMKGWCNPEVDDLVQAAKSESDPDARAQMFRDAQALIAEDWPKLLVVQALQPYVRWADVDAYDIVSTTSYHWDFAELRR